MVLTVPRDKHCTSKLSLPESAASWITAALDPYHDYQLRLEGLPDVVSAPSIVKMHNQSYTLSAPVSAGAGLWDAMVAFTGIHTAIDACPGLVTAKDVGIPYMVYDHGALSSGTPFGSFVVKAEAAGVDFPFSAPVHVDATFEAFGASTAGADRCRIIGVAFEITNTTAAVYRQGSLTVAALPNAVADYGYAVLKDNNVAPVGTSGAQTVRAPLFAANRAALLQVPGAQTWDASEGCYAVPRLSSTDVFVDMPATCGRMVEVADTTTTGVGLTTPRVMATAGVGASTYSTPDFYGACNSNFGAVQVFACGLSPETTLTVTMRTIVEYFPAFNSDLMPLASPSTPFCPEAFEAYSAIVKTAPYAVPVGQNSAGEYFRKVMRIASRLGLAIAPATGEFAPLVSGIAGAVGSAAEAWETWATKRAKKTGAKSFKKEAAPVKPNIPPPKERPTNKVERKEAGARAAPTRR